MHLPSKKKPRCFYSTKKQASPLFLINTYILAQKFKHLKKLVTLGRFVFYLLNLYFGKDGCQCCQTCNSVLSNQQETIYTLETDPIRRLVHVLNIANLYRELSDL